MYLFIMGLWTFFMKEEKRSDKLYLKHSKIKNNSTTDNK